jgi:16S rRNA (uracil1498-N3)-methyltransferase
LERWQRIVREAAEQSERGIIPALAATLPFATALEALDTSPLSLIPYEEEHARSLRAVLAAQTGIRHVNLFIGPEGGFTASEIALAQSRGALPVRLGPRVLRAETAGLAAAAAILYALGEME